MIQDGMIIIQYGERQIGLYKRQMSTVGNVKPSDSLDFCLSHLSLAMKTPRPSLDSNVYFTDHRQRSGHVYIAQHGLDSWETLVIG